MYNFIDGDFFESLSNFTFGDVYSKQIEPTYNNVKTIIEKYEYPILFINTKRLIKLLNVVKEFNTDVKIISHNCITSYGKEILDYIPRNVKKLYCQNYNYIENDIIRSIPVGLERIRWFPEQKKQTLLYDNMNKSLHDKLCYMNFNTQTNKDRQKYYEILSKRDYINTKMIGNGGDYKSYINDLITHKYIISPPGAGIDCHRHWEAIYLGTIPILINSHFVQNIFKDLPVLILDSYDEITEELLINKYNDIIIKQKQFTDYWKNIILNV